MAQRVDFYFDYGSPTSYLAYVQLPGVVERTGAVVNFKPILLGGVFQAAGNVSPMTVAAKGKWMQADMTLFAERYKVPFAMNPHFPVNTLNLMRGAMHAQREGFLQQYSDAMFTAMWAEGRNLGDPAVIASVLASAGMDAGQLMAATQDPAVKEALKAATEAAVRRGVFGAPTLFVGDEMFFGQDRVQFVEERLARLA